MKKILVILTVFLVATLAFSQQRVPAKMVSVSTNLWTVLPTSTNLQGVLDWIDDNITPAAQTNFAPVVTTNTNIKLQSPRWVGDLAVIYGTVTQMWFASGSTTNDWHTLYPTIIITTNTLDTNSTPAFSGQMLGVMNAATNILWVSTNVNSASWKAIYRASP